MRDKVFIDTNVFVYAALEDNAHARQSKSAINLLKDIKEKEVLISTQVLNEFYNVLLRHGISDKVIQRKIEDIIAEAGVSIIKIATIKHCWEIRAKYKYSYWDSLMAAAALEGKCKILYTEDMQHGQVIEETLMIINPFKGV